MAGNIENAVRDVITAKLEEGIIEKLVAENLENGINKALADLLGSYGDITKVIREKIKGVMVNQLSSFDYSNYIVNLDHVLIEILKNTSLDHKKILENFKDLMVNEEFPDVVKLSDVFEQFKKYVAEDVDTSKLDVDFDDGPSYEYVPVTMEVEHEDERSWSSFQYAKVVFECEKDESLNHEIHLSKFEKFPWRMSVEIDTSISSLRHLNKFKVYLLKLKHGGTRIEIDSEYLEDDVEPKAEPEASFS